MPLMLNNSTRLEIIKYFGRWTIKDIVGNQELKSLRRLGKEHTETKVINAITLLLQDASTAFGKRWSSNQAIEAATLLFYSEYSYITLEDVFVLLKEITEQDFKFTTSAVMRHLKRYTENRFELVKTFRQSETAQLKSGGTLDKPKRSQLRLKEGNYIENMNAIIKSDKAVSKKDKRMSMKEYIANGGKAFELKEPVIQKRKIDNNAAYKEALKLLKTGDEKTQRQKEIIDTLLYYFEQLKWSIKDVKQFLEKHKANESLYRNDLDKLQVILDDIETNYLTV